MRNRTHPSIMDIKSIEDRIRQGTGKGLEHLKKFGQLTEREAKDTYLASGILISLLRGQEVSEEQITFLKDQSVNVGKVLVLIGLQAVPGSGVAIILLEKIAEKHGFTLFPKSPDGPHRPE